MALSESELADMAAMHSAHFGHTCLIERFTVTGEDADNHPIGTWATYYEGACHYVERQGEEVETEIHAVIAGSVLQLPQGVLVAPSDRVGWIKDTRGRTVASDVGIESVMDGETGVDVALEEVA